jgi:hypothetical protein
MVKEIRVYSRINEKEAIENIVSLNLTSEKKNVKIDAKYIINSINNISNNRIYINLNTLSIYICFKSLIIIGGHMEVI